MPTALRERNKKRLRQLRLDKRRKMYTGRLVNGIVSLSGAPTNRTWVRYPEDSAEETLAWGNVSRANVPVWVDKNKAGQNEIVGVEYVEGTIRWDEALETVGAPPIIDELLPTSVGELGILPGRISASPQGGTYVRVQAFEHTGGRYPTTDIDVGTEYPATDDAYGRIGLYLDPDTNTVTAFAGEEVFDRSDFTDADKLSVPDGMYPIGAVIVYDGNAISSANTFEDWRLHHSSKGSGAASGLPDFGAQEIVTISSGVLDISGATGRNIVAAAESSTTDTVDSIVGLGDGEMAVFQADAGDTITFAHDAGVLNLYNGANIVLSGSDLLMLVGRSAGEVTQPVDENAAPSGGVVGDYALIQEQQAQNTSGGTFTSGAWQTRPLNTEVHDAGGIATLASNQITLGAGSYRLTFWAVANAVQGHQARFQNITDTATVALSNPGFADNGSGRTDNTLVNGEGEFTIAGTKVFELQHRCNVTKSADGFGLAANLATEIFSSVTIIKTA